MTEQDAKAALRAQGITSPSKSLIENWLRVQQYEEAASPPPPLRETVGDMQPCVSSSVSLEDTKTSVSRPSSESALEPILRERGELQRPAGRRKAGRPRVQAPWFQAVATAMSDGTPLRQALAICGIYRLTPKQIRSLYRNRAFQALYKEARRKWLSEYGVKVRPRGKGLRQLLRSL